jgi:hypothetical protein
LGKAFENRVDRLWPGFKIGKLVLAGFQNWRVDSGWLSKLTSWLWPAFKIGKLALAGFQKLSAQSEKSVIQQEQRNLTCPF